MQASNRQENIFHEMKTSVELARTWGVEHNFQKKSSLFLKEKTQNKQTNNLMNLVKMIELRTVENDFK